MDNRTAPLGRFISERMAMGCHARSAGALRIGDALQSWFNCSVDDLVVHVAKRKTSGSMRFGSGTSGYNYDSWRGWWAFRPTAGGRVIRKFYRLEYSSTKES